MQTGATTLLALQFAAFGWRINREISVGDEGRRTWLPAPDYLNIILMLGVVTCAIVLPLKYDGMTKITDTVIAVGYVIIALHPVNIAAHYRLFSKLGRSKYDDDYPWMTDQECFTLILTVIFAVNSAWLVYTA